MSLELERALAEIPILDVHTHLVGGKLARAACTTYCSTIWLSAISMRRVARPEHG